MYILIFVQVSNVIFFFAAVVVQVHFKWNAKRCIRMCQTTKYHTFTTKHVVLVDTPFKFNCIPNQWYLCSEFNFIVEIWFWNGGSIKDIKNNMRIYTKILLSQPNWWLLLSFNWVLTGLACCNINSIDPQSRLSWPNHIRWITNPKRCIDQIAIIVWGIFTMPITLCTLCVRTWILTAGMFAVESIQCHLILWAYCHTRKTFAFLWRNELYERQWTTTPTRKRRKKPIATQFCVATTNCNSFSNNVEKGATNALNYRKYSRIWYIHWHECNTSSGRPLQRHHARPTIHAIFSMADNKVTNANDGIPDNFDFTFIIISSKPSKQGARKREWEIK